MSEAFTVSAGPITFFSVEFTLSKSRVVRVGFNKKEKWWFMVLGRTGNGLKVLHRSRKPLNGYSSALLAALKHI